MKGARLLTFVGFLTALVVLYAAAGMQPVAPAEVVSLTRSVPATADAGGIWAHNLFIALLELIPVIGIFIGGFSAWTTGLTTASIAMDHGIPSVVLIGNLAFTLFFWLEFSGYALSLTASAWLLKSFVDRTWRAEVPRFAVTVGLMFVVLGVSALVEMAYILH